MDNFSNREIATLLWLALGLGFCLWKPAIREGFGGVVRAALRRQLVIAFSLLFAYVALIIWLLHRIGLWDWDQLKATVYWTVTVGIISMARIARNGGEGSLLRKWIADNLKIVAVIEFVVTFYSAPLLVELILVPVLACIGAMMAIAEGKDEYRSVIRFLNGLLTTIGLVFVAYTLYRIASAFGDFAKVQTLRDFYTPPLLSLSLLPFLFMLLIYVTYENAFLRFRVMIPDSGLRSYAKWRTLLTFRWKLDALRRWSRDMTIRRPLNRTDIDSGICEVLDVQRREADPPVVSVTEGWSPYAAIGFLKENGLVTSEYHRSFDETWWASTPYLELGDELIPDNIAYYVEGDARVAKQLKLVLNVNNPEESSASESTFESIARTLLTEALGQEGEAAADAVFVGRKSGARAVPGRTVKLRRYDGSGSIRGGYERVLTVTQDGAS